MTVDLVLVVLVEAIALSDRAGLGKAVGATLPAFVKDNELSGAGALTRFAEVSPEAGLFNIIAAAVVKTASRLIGNLHLAFFHGCGASHVWGAKGAAGIASGAGYQNGGEGG